MATITKRIQVCDVCRDETRTTSRVNVSGDLGRKRLDLCDEHARPIVLALDPKAKPPREIRRRVRVEP